jgi:hypothetical protein
VDEEQRIDFMCVDFGVGQQNGKESVDRSSVCPSFGSKQIDFLAMYSQVICESGRARTFKKVNSQTRCIKEVRVIFFFFSFFDIFFCSVVWRENTKLNS